MNRIFHHDLLTRILINGCSTLLVALIIILASFPQTAWIFVLGVGGVTGIALWEYYNIVQKKGIAPKFVIGISAGLLYIFSIFLKVKNIFHSFLGAFDFLPELILGLAFLSCFVPYFFSGRDPIFTIATTFFGLVYIAIPMGLFLPILFVFQENGHHFQGSWWIVYLILVTKSADMGGYFVGRKFGKHKLAFRISPKKTIEGFFGALFFSMLISICLCFLGKKLGVFASFTVLEALILGLILGFFGQVGDLAESLLKRDALVKDSNSLPAVGGILDMIDSLLFTAPIMYIFLRLFYN